MAGSTQLENWSGELALAVKALSDCCHDDGGSLAPHLALEDGAAKKADLARRKIMRLASRMQTLLAKPTDFIQHLANQNQLLACLRWLGEFQILACIPLSGSITTREVADLVGVPETQLSRVVRMTATAGVLHEPQPGYVAHTALSAQFVTNLSFLDAAMFLAETAAPTALSMATATQSQGLHEANSAYSVAFNSMQPFQTACLERPRLLRQYSAYRRCAGEVDDSIVGLLGRLNWLSLGNACIVDACAQSTAVATALAELFPALHFVVQMTERAGSPNGSIGSNGTSDSNGSNGTNGAFDSGKIDDFNGRITVHSRAPAATQLVKDAAAYIIRLTTPSTSLAAQIIPELNAHLSVLRSNRLATLILAPPLLPEPGTVDPDVEAMARLRDLCCLQLHNECELELDELIDMVTSVRDSRGQLVVVNKLRSSDGATMALGIKYHAFADGPYTAEPSIL